MALSVETVKEREEFIRLLIYGPQGVGKTTWAAQAPNPVLLDYENSAETLRGTALESIPLAGTKKELANPENVLAFIKSKNEYDTIIIDSISSMSDSFLMEHMKAVKSRDRHLALFADFRKMTNVIKEIFYELITVNKNVVLVAHTKVLRDKADGEGVGKIVEIRPRLPPELQDAIQRLINEVFYMESKAKMTGGSDRILHVDSQGKILAKNRRHLDKAKYENPTWKDIYK